MNQYLLVPLSYRYFFTQNWIWIYDFAKKKLFPETCSHNGFTRNWTWNVTTWGAERSPTISIIFYVVAEEMGKNIDD